MQKRNQGIEFSNKRVQIEEDSKENIEEINKQEMKNEQKIIITNRLMEKQTYAELDESIKIFLRIKPPYQTTSDNLTLQSSNFNFHQIFSSIHSQLDIFESILPSLKQTFKGYNSTIFTYGQTASGKTYTITGEDDNPGIVPRVFEYMFRCFRENIGMSVLEIYNEQLTDLLVENKEEGNELKNRKKNLMIRETIENGINVTNLTKVILKNKKQANELYYSAIQRRRKSETYRNKESSRSHCILILWFKCTDGQVKRESRMNIVDLAGSEKIGENHSPKRDENENSTIQNISSCNDTITELLNNFQQKRVQKLNVQQKNMETGNINKSLLTLREVIKKLSKKQNDHISYRDSKLTFLLKDSLGGNSNLIVIGTIDLKFTVESLNTLKFLNMIKLIKNTPISVVEIQSNDLRNELISVYERNKELELQINEMKSICRCDSNSSNFENRQLSCSKNQILNDFIHDLRKNLGFIRNNIAMLKGTIKNAINYKFQNQQDFLLEIDEKLSRLTNELNKN